MFSADQVTEIYFKVDEFMIRFNNYLSAHTIGKKPKRQAKMNLSEVMTLMILFQLSDIRSFKSFYTKYVSKHMTKEFPVLVSYNRFVELQKKALLPMILFAKTSCLGSCTGLSFIDSTAIRVCKNKRIFNHKVFDGIATRGKSTMGYFYGFKLHLVVNELGQILDFQITQANVDDRTPVKNGTLIKNIWGKLFADKGYLNKDLALDLLKKGIQYFTGIRKNMKNQLMTLFDKIVLRKRSIIETINDQLKNVCMIEHSRHRSFHNFINNLVAGIISYSFLPNKPAIKFDVKYEQSIYQNLIF